MTERTAITPHIHRLVIPFLDIYTTVFLIETPDGALLFDTATYPEDADNYILPAFRELGISPDTLHCVVVSHNHRDHAGSLPRIHQEFPEAFLLTGSAKLREQYPDASFLSAEDGTKVLNVLEVVTIPGHTGDAIGILDARTGTLLSGDGLQLFGIYGSGKWGANISQPAAHRRAVEKLRTLPLNTIAASHDYHPGGHIARGKAEINAYLSACTEALDCIRDAILRHPEQDDETLSAEYNRTSGLPTVAPHVFAAVRKTI